MIFPLLLWTLLGTVTLMMKGASSLAQAWRQLALPMVVVIAAGHMAKGIAKFTSWGGFLPDAIREPSGIETVKALTSGASVAPASLLGMPFVAAIGLTLVVMATIFSIREAKLVDADTYRAQIPSILMLAGLFGFIISGWF
jgi:hypothetical protein